VHNTKKCSNKKKRRIKNKIPRKKHSRNKKKCSSQESLEAMPSKRGSGSRHRRRKMSRGRRRKRRMGSNEIKKS